MSMQLLQLLVVFLSVLLLGGRFVVGALAHKATLRRDVHRVTLVYSS